MIAVLLFLILLAMFPVGRGIIRVGLGLVAVVVMLAIVVGISQQ